jgi:spore cortex biosynthesis protein YabQ
VVELPVSVSNQAYIFLCSVLGGMLIAFLYDVFRIKRKAVKTSSFIVYIEDLIYWIIVALVMFGVVYYSNQGEVRGYIFIGTAIGVILYLLLLSKLVMRASLFVLRIVFKVLRTVWLILTYPIRVVFKVLKIPGTLMLKGLKKVKRAGKSRLSGVRIWRRLFRNIRKKI